MFRPEANAALFVAFLVIPPDGVQQRLALLIEPHGREQTACRLDTLHRRARALVRNHLHREARRPQRALVTHVVHPVVRRPVVWQDAESLAVPVGPQPIDMSGKRLPDGLVIVQVPKLPPDPLLDHDGAGVCLGSGPADVPYRPDLHQRIDRQPRDAAFLAGLLDVRSVVRALVCCDKIALPDVGVLLGALRHILLAVAIKHRRKPRVVPEIDLGNLRVARRVLSEPLVCRAVLALGVPRHPDF